MMPKRDAAPKMRPEVPEQIALLIASHRAAREQQKVKREEARARLWLGLEASARKGLPELLQPYVVLDEREYTGGDSHILTIAVPGLRRIKTLWQRRPETLTWEQTGFANGQTFGVAAFDGDPAAMWSWAYTLEEALTLAYDEGPVVSEANVRGVGDGTTEQDA